MNPDIICIGHITHDRIVTPDRDVHMPGGTSFYFSYGLRHLMGDRKDINYRLITSLAEKDMKSVEDMRREGIEVEVIPSRETVYFENIYGANQNNRRLVVDAQGYLREVRGEEVHAIDWKEKREALRYVDILKVNEYEIEVLTGVTDQHRACELLAEWGVKEVLLTLGSYGSVVYADGKFYDIPAYDPLNVVDATGCGDTYVMAYVYRRLLGDDPGQAGRFASAVASIKLEASGPFCGTEADALARLKP